jgi:hypothetical protein
MITDCNIILFFEYDMVQPTNADTLDQHFEPARSLRAAK